VTQHGIHCLVLMSRLISCENLTHSLQYFKVVVMESSIYKVEHNSPTWPSLLNQVSEKVKPAALNVKGKLPPNDALIVAVVGTRRPSHYGIDVADSITRSLAKKGVVIVSGLAIGIDTIAHKAALAEGTPTLAVVGCGLNNDVMYPKQNVPLAEIICLRGGALISEYENDKNAEVWTFPQRNRIIAGIAHSTIVIEAGEKSGAIITARHALEFGREVFAVPGSIYSSQSVGTNTLIKEGAQPITSADDLFKSLGIEFDNIRIETSINSEEKKVLQALSSELQLNDLIKITQLSPTKILAAASSLELKGLVKDMGGGIWRKK
jgi:DNA processing protein